MRYCPECDELLMTPDDSQHHNLASHPAQPMMNLSAAIACGDLAGARHWLEQVAAIMGEEAQTAIDAGRFNPSRARGPGTLPLIESPAQ